MAEPPTYRIDLPCFYARYDDGGHDMAVGIYEEPDGIFTAWCPDGGSLTMKNDRSRVYPPYTYAGDRDVCVSPPLTCLLGEG